MFKKLIATLLALFTVAAFAAVDVNKASLADLEAIKGIGPAAAGKILDERKKGSFKDWSDVMTRVGGIKEARAAKLSQAGLTVNGEAFKGGAASSAKGDKPTRAKAAKGDKSARKADARSSEPKLAKQ